MEHCDGGDLGKVRRAALHLEESGKGRKSRKWSGAKAAALDLSGEICACRFERV